MILIQQEQDNDLFIKNLYADLKVHYSFVIDTAMALVDVEAISEIEVTEDKEHFALSLLAEVLAVHMYNKPHHFFKVSNNKVIELPTVEFMGRVDVSRVVRKLVDCINLIEVGMTVCYERDIKENAITNFFDQRVSPNLSGSAIMCDAIDDLMYFHQKGGKDSKYSEYNGLTSCLLFLLCSIDSVANK